MKNEVIIALCDALVEKHLKDNPIVNERGPRGLRGKAGLDGEGFNFKRSEEEINSSIEKELSKKLNDLKLKFKDLSEEEVSQLKGPRGQKGKAGLALIPW